MKIKRNSLVQFYTNDLENVTEVEAGKKKKIEVGEKKRDVVNTI